MLDIPKVFQGSCYVILTLYCDNDEVIKQRILNRDNGNLHCDWDISIKTNALIRSRKKLPNEYRILNTSDDVDTTFKEILDILENHIPTISKDIGLSRSDFYSYIKD